MRSGVIALTLLVTSLAMSRGSRVLCLNNCLEVYSACEEQCDKYRASFEPEARAVLDTCEECTLNLVKCRIACPKWTLFDYEYEDKKRPE
ncbi:hypothetical protein LSH36_399g03016 [Paralvinella palmiformis]|uniref:4Fe-4S ferredoxin-type domain-containing protein n=1 Tax=Paralvinella palmiformis TaxID=53620 RepID=A0AAD9JCZ1_9ANNE|nr:hypothetical protein LSH36_399g03016 [Paralvinella palmiformis]